MGTWKGRPNYECVHCPYKTLDRAAMQAHVLSHLAPARPMTPSGAASRLDSQEES